MRDDIANDLRGLNVFWQKDVSLREQCHWRIGGLADFLVEPCSVEEVQSVYRYARDRKIPFLVLGCGSNILFDDKGFRGIVIKLGRRFSRCRFDGNLLSADAGIWGPMLARASASRGLSGLEHIVGIPGSFGGLIYMNAGSLRRNIGDNIVSVRVIDDNGELKMLAREQCGFRYRHSIFQENNYLVLGGSLQLIQQNRAAVRAAMTTILAERRGKFPLDLPNCGSVFSNDEQLYEQYGPPGKIIDQAGYKGMRCGDAQVSMRHANFIVNLGHASSLDVMNLVRELRKRIKALTGFDLHCEVRYLRPDGVIGPLEEFL